MLWPIAVNAGGLAASRQPVDALFSSGIHAEVAAASANASVSGTDIIPQSTGAIAPRLNLFSAALKRDITDTSSFALLLDEPYKRRSKYASGAFAGANGELNSLPLAGLLRHRFTRQFSVYGGARIQRSEARVDTPVVLAGVLTYEYQRQTGSNASFFTPTGGFQGVGLAVIWTIKKAKISAGVRYIDYDDVQLANVGSFTGNTAVILGIRTVLEF